MSVAGAAIVAECSIFPCEEGKLLFLSIKFPICLLGMLDISRGRLEQATLAVRLTSSGPKLSKLSKTPPSGVNLTFIVENDV